MENKDSPAQTELANVATLMSTNERSIDMNDQSYTHIEGETITETKTEGGWVEKIKTKIHHYIGHLNEAHEFTLDNEYILTGYRIISIRAAL